MLISQKQEDVGVYRAEDVGSVHLEGSHCGRQKGLKKQALPGFWETIWSVLFVVCFL